MEQGLKSKSKHGSANFCISHETALPDRNFFDQELSGTSISACFALSLEQFLILLLRRQHFGLVNEHDGNVVPDFIQKLTGGADKAVLIFRELDRSLAFGADNDVKKLLADHGICSSWIGHCC
jgi:hypothetical protein